MPPSEQQLVPTLVRLLRDVGENIRLARLRRGHSAALVAERAGISRTTLHPIERGEPGVSLGAVARVLLALSLETDLGLVARDDVLGRKLQDIGLTVKRRAPKRARSVGYKSSSSSATGRKPESVDLDFGPIIGDESGGEPCNETKSAQFK